MRVWACGENERRAFDEDRPYVRYIKPMGDNE